MDCLFFALNSPLDDLPRFNLSDEYDIRWRYVHNNSKLILLPRFNYFFYGGDLVVDLELDRLLDYVMPLPHSDKLVFCLFLNGSIDMNMVTEYFREYDENILMSKIHQFNVTKLYTKEERLIRLCMVCIFDAAFDRLGKPFTLYNVKHRDIIASAVASRMITDFKYWDFSVYADPILLLELVTAKTDDEKIIRFITEKIYEILDRKKLISLYLSSPLLHGRPELLARAIDALENVLEISSNQLLDRILCDTDEEIYKIKGIFEAFELFDINVKKHPCF